MELKWNQNQITEKKKKSALKFKGQERRFKSVSVKEQKVGA